MLPRSTWPRGGTGWWSPTWPTADFFLFPKAKDNLAGIPNNGETAKTRWGQAVSIITASDFTKAFQKWIERWDQE